MKQINGLFWPENVGDKWQHALRHVKSLDWSVEHCPQRRTAVQAGGNIGLWPLRLSQDFDRVITFEPDSDSRACLMRNVPPFVEVRSEALGSAHGTCSISHKSLGSHKVTQGDSIQVMPLDALELDDLDLLQLDIEGYEWHALIGATQTIERCHPLIQVELRAGFGELYGTSDTKVRQLIASMGYVLVSQQPGSDFVFRWQR